MTTTFTRFDTAKTVAASLAMYAGHMSQWVHILPSRETAQAAFDALPADLQAELASRAARHGLDAVDLMRRTPKELWDNPEAFETFLSMMDVSHIKPVSTHPELADDPSNVIWELSSDNRARGAQEMTGAEFSEANDGARDVARDLTDSTSWWDMNDMFKGFLDSASLLGYTTAWLPKSVWLDMMRTIQHDLPLIDKEQTFSGKYNRARNFALKIRTFFQKHGHQTAAAFMLAMLTLWWPPAQFFVGMWAMAGVLSVVLHYLQKLSTHLQRKYRFFRFLKHIDVSVEKFRTIIVRIRDFLGMIKDGVFAFVSKTADMFFGVLKQAVKVVQPYVVKTIKKAKSLLDGFIGWVGSFFRKSTPAMAT